MRAAIHGSPEIVGVELDETFLLGVTADEILRDVSCRRFDVLIREFRPFSSRIAAPTNVAL